MTTQHWSFMEHRLMQLPDDFPSVSDARTTAVSATKLAEELLARIERARDAHGTAITRDMIIDVAVMCGCVNDTAST